MMTAASDQNNILKTFLSEKMMKVWAQLDNEDEILRLSALSGIARLLKKEGIRFQDLYTALSDQIGSDFAELEDMRQYETPVQKSKRDFSWDYVDKSNHLVSGRNIPSQITGYPIVLQTNYAHQVPHILITVQSNEINYGPIAVANSDGMEIIRLCNISNGQITGRIRHPTDDGKSPYMVGVREITRR